MIPTIILTESERRLVAAILQGLEDTGVAAQRYPNLMSTSDVAQIKGCSPVTVQRNWRAWGLQLMGRGPTREMQFSGLSVQRHIERTNTPQRQP